MKKKLVWKELSDDGLLKEPGECGPHYSKESINQWGGFDTKEEAIEKLKKMKNAYAWDVTGDYMLVTIYSP